MDGLRQTSSAPRSKCPRIGRTPLSAPSSSPWAAGRADGDRIGIAPREPGRTGRSRHPDRRGRRGVLHRRAARPLRHRRRGTLAAPATAPRSTAATSSTTSSPPTSRPTTNRGRRRTSRRRASFADDCENAQRRSAGEPFVERNRRRHGRDPRRARRGEAHVPRLLVRHVPRCAVRRPLPARTCARSCSTVRWTPRSPSSSHARAGRGLRQRAARLPRRLRAHRLRLRRRRSAARLRPRSLPRSTPRRCRARSTARSAARTRRSRPRCRERAVRRNRRVGHPRRRAQRRRARRRVRRSSASATSTPAARPGGVYDNSQPAFFGIGCLDAPAPSAEELPAVAAADRAGRARVRCVDHVAVVAVLGVAGSAGRRSRRRCAARVRRRSWCSGTSNDPATPLRWAEGLADQLESGAPRRLRG